MKATQVFTDDRMAGNVRTINSAMARTTPNALHRHSALAKAAAKTMTTPPATKPSYQLSKQKGKKESKTALLPGPNKHTCATYTTATRKSKKTHYTLPDTTASTRSGRFANREQTYATCTTRMQPTGQRMNVDDFSCKRCFPSV